MTKRTRLFIIPIILLGVCLIVVGMLVVSGLNDKVGKADPALILGNTVEVDGRPSWRLQARLDKALQLYRAGYFATILVSGGVGKEGYNEATVMTDYLVARGVSLENIIVDSAGINTFTSAQNTVQILDRRGLKSVFVVSQYFHIPRSRLILKRLGVKAIYSTQAKFFEWRDIYSSVREVVAYISYSFCRVSK